MLNLVAMAVAVEEAPYFHPLVPSRDLVHPSSQAAININSLALSYASRPIAEETTQDVKETL